MSSTGIALKVVLVGNIGSGKTVLGTALARALDLPFVALDDCRCRQGDGSAAGEAAAWCAFLAAAGDASRAVLECSGTGPFAHLLRHALTSSAARVLVVWIRTPLEECRRRIEGRTWSTPYPSFGVPMERVLEQVEASLGADLSGSRSWPGKVLELNGTQGLDVLLGEILTELGVDRRMQGGTLGVFAYQPPWRRSAVAPCGTHHVVDGVPLYAVRFERAMSFHAPGLAPVRTPRGWCHVDATGRPIYEQRYVQAFGFYEGRAAVEDESGWLFVGTDGRPISGGRYAWAGNFQGGRATVRFNDRLYAHVTQAGESAYAARHRYAGDFREGVAVVMDSEGRHFHIDASGARLHERSFSDLDVFHKKHARARDTRGWHHVDRMGSPIHDRRFAAAEPFYNGQSRVERADGGLEVIDETGRTIIEIRRGQGSRLQRLSSDLVGFWRTQAVRAGVDVGVFEALPGDTEKVARSTGLATSVAGRLLRSLWELGVVEPDAANGWRATETGDLLVHGSGSGMDDAARIWGCDHYRRWLEVVPALRSGGTRAGPSFFEALMGEELERYHRAINGYARNDYAALHEAVDWSRHHRVIDAGGGRGALLKGLLGHHPALAGCLLDLPEVVAGATVPADLSVRLKVAAADLFRPWPERGDAIILARVLHDWPDADAVKILVRSRAALEPGGRVYVLELILRDDSPNGGLLDLNMLVMTGGRERSEADFRSILNAAGLRLVETRSLPSVSSILIAEAA